MGMTLGESRGPQAEINITPLIDVLLVLLIIFMIITPRMSVGIATELPHPNPSPKEITPVTTVVVQVGTAGLRINHDPIPLEQLQFRLMEIFKTRAEKVCFVKGERGLEFGDMAKVIDLIKGAGIRDIGLLTS